MFVVPPLCLWGTITDKFKQHRAILINYSLGSSLLSSSGLAPIYQTVLFSLGISWGTPQAQSPVEYLRDLFLDPFYMHSFTLHMSTTDSSWVTVLVVFSLWNTSLPSAGHRGTLTSNLHSHGGRLHLRLLWFRTYIFNRFILWWKVAFLN